MPFRLPGNTGKRVGDTRWLGRACPVLGSISRWKTRGEMLKNQTGTQYRFHVSRRQLNLKIADWLSLVWHAICSTETEFWQSGTPDDICINCPFTIIFFLHLGLPLYRWIAWSLFSFILSCPLAKLYSPFPNGALKRIKSLQPITNLIHSYPLRIQQQTF